MVEETEEDEAANRAALIAARSAVAEGGGIEAKLLVRERDELEVLLAVETLLCRESFESCLRIGMEFFLLNFSSIAARDGSGSAKLKESKLGEPITLILSSVALVVKDRALLGRCDGSKMSRAISAMSTYDRLI